MFTGLIESVGQVVTVAPTASGCRLVVGTPLAAELRAGDSVAVNGVCLTVAAVEPDGRFAADVGPETVRVTTLGGLVPGRAVNLERAMRADGRFGGHFVQGHVDGLGTVTALREDGDARWVSVGLPDAAGPFVVPKGSIAVDGISLTVAGLRDDRFEVMIVPFTWSHTHLATLRVGDRVNLEFDLVAKYVARSLEAVGRGG